MDQLRRAVRVTVGLALGGASAFAEAAFVVLATPVLAFPGARYDVFAGARRLAELERARLARFLGNEADEEYEQYNDWRALEYLAIRSVVGGLGAGIFLLIAWGAVSGAIMLWQVVSGRPLGGGDAIGRDQDWYDPIVLVLLGALLLFLAVQGLIGVAALDRELAHRFLGPTERERLQHRVSQLRLSRTMVIDAVNEERRRIERDLHDGVQQRLVALGMLLGRARRSPDSERTATLLHQAHEESQQALEDLREVAWRVYPIVLDEEGLHAALEALAERSSLPVALHYELAERADPATETVAYFVVSEAVTNAIKHAAASLIGIDVHAEGTVIVVRITDDGVGGARVHGDGLSGLGRRVMAADGVFTVDSPVGGPTVVTAELPCA